MKQIDMLARECNFLLGEFQVFLKNLKVLASTCSRYDEPEMASFQVEH